MGLNIIKYLSMVIIIASVHSNAHALSAEGKIYTSPKGEFVFNSTLDHKEEIVYEQSQSDVRLVKVVNNKKPEIENANLVAGKDLGGHSKLILKKIDEDSVSIEVDRKEYHNKKEPTVLNYKVVGKFAQGNWSDLISDKYVKIQIAPEAQKTFRSKVKIYLESFIKNIANKSKMAALFGGFKGAQIDESQFALDASILEGTKKEIKQEFDIKTQFVLY